MKRFALIGMCVAALAIGLAGCNWETGNDATNWSSSYNWVNFSGVYRGVGGGLLVTDYTTTPTIPGVTNIYSKTESGGTMPARGTTASGTVSHGAIVPGSFMVKVGSIATLADPGKAGVLSGSGTGVVNYDGGTWSITMDTWSTESQSISVSYSYTVTRDGTASSGAQSGATRVKIYSFNVSHNGQHLTIVDNNGSTYTGYISQIRSLSGAENTDIQQVSGDEQARSAAAKITYYESKLPEDGDAISATFECSGVSAAMMQVKIVGSLQGTVASGVFTGRTLSGTWIELGGKTGDINGQTTTVPIVTTATDTATDTATETAATE